MSDPDEYKYSERCEQCGEDPFDCECYNKTCSGCAKSTHPTQYDMFLAKCVECIYNKEDDDDDDSE